MTRLFVDTATSDRWTYGREIPDLAQPHMIRLAWMLEEDDGATVEVGCHLIKLPDGVKIASEAQHFTGIYQHIVDSRGFGMFDALSEFAMALGMAELVVAHSWSGHRQVLDRSLRYVGMPARNWPPAIDVMQKATKIVQTPATDRAGWKWPTFDQCCVKFLGKELRNTLDPVEDGIAKVTAVRTFYNAIVQAGLA